MAAIEVQSCSKPGHYIGWEGISMRRVCGRLMAPARGASWMYNPKFVSTKPYREALHQILPAQSWDLPQLR